MLPLSTLTPWVTRQIKKYRNLFSFKNSFEGECWKKDKRLLKPSFCCQTRQKQTVLISTISCERLSVMLTVHFFYVTSEFFLQHIRFVLFNVSILRVTICNLISLTCKICLNKNFVVKLVSTDVKPPFFLIIYNNSLSKTSQDSDRIT